ncbi:hypothetical protein GCM10010383_49160 [Streptomyces lomondensis]|uniref:Uncharacterized protein n=1 Tax=Streptomyces lomondensis TaxID=68229 RepID=A0ABQ2XE91_9ACTN|nr:hypothetical protein GCM10010383_49160 [Streptomyces lomondensis]
MQQGEFQQAGHRFRVPARHAAPPYGPGIHAIPGLAQSVSTVWMLLRPVPGHRPSHPRFAVFPQRNYARPGPAPQHGSSAPEYRSAPFAPRNRPLPAGLLSQDGVACPQSNVRASVITGQDQARLLREGET